VRNVTRVQVHVRKLGGSGVTWTPVISLASGTTTDEIDDVDVAASQVLMGDDVQLRNVRNDSVSTDSVEYDIQIGACRRPLLLGTRMVFILTSGGGGIVEMEKIVSIPKSEIHKRIRMETRRVEELDP